ncbi:DUF11 domain-containing protein [Streptomyces sp. NPDC019396]|uniref:DUF11 domain-containing protein n=1 Tax=Streptomyces sp. NPDC019396 TaxID=3154687 RepID=UPI0033DC57D5
MTLQTRTTARRRNASRLVAAAACAVLLQVAGGVPAASATVAAGHHAGTRAVPADCLAQNAYILAGPKGRSEGTSVQQVDLGTGVRTEIGNFTVPAGVAVNGLGMMPGGEVAWAVSEEEDSGTGTQTVFRLDLNTNTTTTFAGAAKIGDGSARETVRGAMNPTNGWFYYSHSMENPNDENRPTTQVIYAFDTVNNVSVGAVGTLTDPQFNGSSGDMVFDSAGNLYVVISTPEKLATGGINSALVRINEDLPTTPGNIALTADLLADLPNGAAYGVTLGADGYLYTTRARVTPAGELFKINPNSGALVSSTQMTTPADKEPTPVDAGNCSYGPNIASQADIPERAQPNDQFTVTITGNGITSGNSGTTAGSDTGPQNTPPEMAGPLPGVVGATYTFTQEPASGTDPADYTTTYQCVDTAHSNTLLTEGSGTSFQYTVPASSDTRGVAVLCTFTNTPEAAPPEPSTLQVDKTAVVRDTAIGRTVTYTLTVTNASTNPATGVRAEDDLSDVVDNATYNNDAAASTGGVTYEVPKMIWTGDLEPGQTATITYSVTVEPDDQLVNNVTVTAPNSNCPGDPQCTTSTTTPVGDDPDPGVTAAD